MKIKTDITEYIQNFDNEIDSESEWIITHMYMMRNELISIIHSLRIANIIEKEYEYMLENNIRGCYSPVRSALIESIPYRIIMGLGKLLVGNKEYSINKTINKMRQMPEFNKKPNVMSYIKKIEDFIFDSPTVKAVATLRDGFYAHLDKASVISDCRVDVMIPLKNIHENELLELLRLLKCLYESSCDYIMPIDVEDINHQEVIEMIFNHSS